MSKALAAMNEILDSERQCALNGVEEDHALKQAYDKEVVELCSHCGGRVRENTDGDKVMIERYDIGDQQPALDRQRAIGAVANLEDSLALVHSLIEKAVASGNLALANGLLQTLSKMSKEYEMARELLA